MPTFRSPTVRRRRLAAELRRLRGDRTGDDVAAGLGWSASKVSRYELARTSLKPAEVEKLLDYYGVVDSERSQLLTLAHEATQKGWWEDYADVLTEEYQAFIGLEAEATSLAQWQADIVPGLLQTEEYARQVHLGAQRVAPIPPGVVERRVKVRMIRQEVLTRDPPLDLSVVIDESVLLRRIGDRSVMHAQLQRLAQLADRPNVTLRIKQLNSDHSLIVNSFVIFRFGPPGETMLHDVVSTEHLIKDEIYVEGETDTYLYQLAFESHCEEALTPAESRKLIVQTVQEVWV